MDFKFVRMQKRIIEETVGGYIVQVKRNIFSSWKSVSGIVSYKRAVEIYNRY